MTTFNDYSAEIISTFNLFKWPQNLRKLANNLDIIDNIFVKFPKKPSIKMMLKIGKITKFSLQQVTLVDVRKAIKDISLDKSSSSDIQLIF